MSTDLLVTPHTRWRTDAEVEKYKAALTEWAQATAASKRRVPQRKFFAERGLSYNRLFSLIYKKNGGLAPLNGFYQKLVSEYDIAGSRYGKGRDYGNPKRL